ncbi:hypothetical protein BSK65_04895 [Paenibacillus odorifer]|uniref:Uncharacterized protein n=1 Tax=Paenibacillus odorifer TaxID=189426 RepID=A0A1R0ZM19_9BACL|nr:hypothetical protein [Paenibacillus odorifer]OME73140.1 hypothetical protein BSK65_04895 [Paenibacillus odorifer]
MQIKYIGNCQASVEVIQRLRATEEVNVGGREQQGMTQVKDKTNICPRERAEAAYITLSSVKE